MEFGWTTAVIGAAVTLVYVAVDGPAMKAVAETWAAADADDQPALLAAADVLRHADVAGFAVWTMVLAGVTPLLYGTAVVISSDYPPWIGWAAVAAGVLGVAQGLITFFNGLDTFTVFVLTPVAVLTMILWTMYMGPAHSEGITDAAHPAASP